MESNVLICWKTNSLLLSVFVFSLCSFGWAANISSTATGRNWEATSSWVGGVVPGPGDVVTIVSGATITVNSNRTVTSVIINSGGTLNLAANLTGDVTLNGGTLTNTATVSPSVTGNITSMGNNNSTITVNGNASTLYVTGNLTTNTGNNVSLNTNGPGVFSVANVTVSVNNNVNINNNSTNSTLSKVVVRNNLTLSNQSSMSISGVIVVKGIFDAANNGNISIDGNGAFSAQGQVFKGINTIDPSLSYCEAPDPCVFALENPTNKCNKVCIALGGFPGNGGSTTLPVTLVQFSVRYESVQAQVRLGWTTSSEINNDFFTIERSADAIHYEAIETVKGAGNSRETLAYVTYDANPLPGINYYRLKQTDFDGQFAYDKPMAVENMNKAKFGFNLVPNPGNGQQMNLALKGEGMDQILVSVYGHLGQMVYESVESVTDGKQLSIQLRQSLPNGIYWVKVQKGNETVTRQMLVSNQ